MGWREAVRGSMLPQPRRTALVLVVAAAAAALVQPLTSLEAWVGWLPSTVSASESGAVWVSMVVSTTAAWVSGQTRAHGLEQWASTSPRSAAERAAPSMVLVGACAVGGQALALLVLAVVSLRFGISDGMAELDLLLSVPTTAAHLLAWVAVGTWLGRRARRELSLPVAAILPYALYATMLLAPSGLAAVLAIGDGRTFDYVRPTVGAFVVRAVFWVALAAALWVLLLERRRLARGLTAVTVAVGVAAGLAGADLTGVRGAEEAVCVGARPVSCLDRAHATAMTRYRTAVEQVWPSIPQPLQPAVIGSHELVLREQPGPSLVAAPVAGYTEPARIVDSAMFAARLGDALFLRECRPGSPGRDTADALVLWWRTERDVPIDGSAVIGDTDYASLGARYTALARAAEVFGAAPGSTRDQWFAAHADAVRSCRAPALAGT